ncbi:MAG TPA: SPOR domain-containing protein [Sphingomicrobium sp.]|nr:SPOR domain-containing protein [Sphingomicrobium sp.]
MAFAAPAGGQNVQSGIEAWQRTNFAEAVAIWRPLAEAGDPDAAFNLGQAYRLGRGVPINLGAAQTWLERAARKDHLDAQTTLGLLLFESGNRAGGLRWLKTAAERGDPRALLVYGTALFNGDGVARDPVLAYAYVSRAAAQGLAPAKTTLAEMDSILPLDQRQKGVALALDRANSTRAAPTPPGKVAPSVSQPAKATAVAPAPAARSTAPAATAASANGNWRVQLGAFSQRSSAEALYKKLAGSGPLAGKQQYLIPAGAVTRLQVGPFESRAAATAACAAMTARGQPCFPVAAN